MNIINPDETPANEQVDRDKTTFVKASLQELRSAEVEHFFPTPHMQEFAKNFSEHLAASGENIQSRTLSQRIKAWGQRIREILGTEIFEEKDL